MIRFRIKVVLERGNKSELWKEAYVVIKLSFSRTSVAKTVQQLWDTLVQARRDLHTLAIGR